MTSSTALVCPTCGSSFRPGFTACNKCQVALIDADSYRAQQASRGSPRETLRDKDVVAIVHAGLPACREIERALLEAGVLCFVAAEEEEGEALAPGALKVGVMVAQDDVAAAGDVLRKRFEALIEKEGGGALNLAAIDLTQAEVTCPACGHTGALVDGACADCGLHLGVS